MEDDREGVRFFAIDPAKLDDPFADFRYFREHHRVFRYAPLNSWFVFRYDDVAAMLADPRLSANRMSAFLDATPAPARAEVREIEPYLEKFRLMRDGAAHAHTRHLVEQGFKAAVEPLSEKIRAAAVELLGRTARGCTLDVAADYAFLLPAWALSNLMGVRERDRARVVRWSVDFIDFFNIVPITVDIARRMARSAIELRDYMRELLAERQTSPQEDFLGTLLAASGPGGALSEDEIVANGILILLAGHVAVRNLIGNAVYLLLANSGQFAKLKAEPALLENAIEETLRYEAPVATIPRVALEDLEVGGVRIARGESLQLSIASANRDAAHFPEPERFEITRRPGRTLSFGHGPHGCLEVHLARMEARIALEVLFARASALELDSSRPIVWYRNLGNRAPINLPIKL